MHHSDLEHRDESHNHPEIRVELSEHFLEHVNLGGSNLSAVNVIEDL